MGCGWAERDGDRESEAGFGLWAVSIEPNTGLEPTIRKIMTWAEVGCLTGRATQVPQQYRFYKGSIYLTFALKICILSLDDCYYRVCTVYVCVCHYHQKHICPWGAWVAQSVKRPTSAQVMILRSVSLSPASGSGLMARSLEPVSDSVSPSLCFED